MCLLLSDLEICDPANISGGHSTCFQKRVIKKELLLILAAVVVAGSAQAVTITVNSGSFENPTPPTDGNWGNLDSAWSAAIVPTGLGYQENNGDNMTPQNGLWSTYLNNTGEISQNLNFSVLAGTTLSVNFFGGKAVDTYGAGNGGTFNAIFTIGGISYMSADYDTTGIAVGTWKEFNFTTAVTDGGNVSLAFVTKGGNAWLDNVSNVTVPDGGQTAMLLGISLVGLLAANHLWRKQYC